MCKMNKTAYVQNIIKPINKFFIKFLSTPIYLIKLQNLSTILSVFHHTHLMMLISFDQLIVETKGRTKLI